ncbi:lipocalin family protein [Mycolicibacterium vaccae]|uniref:lipocalin family protein n=1 Tax=Mycolicibacterium vaccae TaxID=1810 RepID=UPI003D06618E
MTSRRWLVWLGTAGAGACLALGAGAGVAGADTDSGDTNGSASRTADSAPARTESRRVDADTGSSTSSARQRTRERAENSPDPADVSRVYTLDRDANADNESTAAVQRTAERSAAREARETRRRAARTLETPVTAPTAPAVPVVSNPPAAQRLSAESAVTAGPVTGVKKTRASLTIPVGSREYNARADWYLPTQADGSTTATGVIWLQHGFLGSKASVSALARNLSQQTNSIVVAPNLPSFPGLACMACWINGAAMQQGVATMFVGDRSALNSSAGAAGYQGTLPEDFVLSGQSSGGGFATSVGGFYAADPTATGGLRGIVMFDGVAWRGRLTAALQSLEDPFVPIYQVASPSSPWNDNSGTTNELVAARPGQFVGVTLARGSHADALIGGNPLLDLFAQLVSGFSPPGNTAAATTLATGWINDLYRGLGPADGTGIYGAPDQYIVLGEAAGVVLSAPPVVDLDRYLGTWYEVGSVKQFFSLGLVNTTAVYSLNPDGSIRVQNSGNYFFDNGPRSAITGAALPVDPDDNKLNVRFFGPASSEPPGNYWIVDLDPDYQWAIVTDPSGSSGFLLSRTRTVSADFYQELLDRASVKGVVGRITPTRQPAADTTSA